MRSTLLAVILLAGVPLGAYAVTVEGEKSLVLTEAPPDNAYLAGLDIQVNAPVKDDLSAAGASVTVAAPVEGDTLIAGGEITIDAPLAADLRAVGARITVNHAVEGDLVAAGGAVVIAGHAQDLQVYGGTVRVSGGADGKVTIYGGDVFLSGAYAGDVEVIASDRVTLGENTTIAGSFRYNAPQEAGIPGTAVISGGSFYTGAATHLPSAEEAARFAIAGATIFFLVKFAAAVIAAGLVAGIFPRFSRRITTRLMDTPRRELLVSGVLGFALIVATPFLLLLLALSFVGIGIALILGALYLLLLMLAYLFAGFITGATIMRRFTHRAHTAWKEAVFGMAILFLISAIPVVGGFILFIITAVTAGVIARIAYVHAFVTEQSA